MDAALLTLIKHRQPRSILILGASDTGKTILIQHLLAEWNPVEPIAVVDCDVGQSHLGPPTTIGWGLVTLPFLGWSRVAVRGIAFTGSVSPEGNLDAFLQATARMVDAATRTRSRLIVDTTGLVNGELGKTLKTRKVDLLKPDLILAIQRDKELEELLAFLPHGSIERLTASPGCVRRSLSERAAYRDKQLARYFANSVKQILALDRLKFIGLGSEWHTSQVALSPALLSDRIVGLRTVHGEDLALGLLRKVEPEQNILAVLTPLRDVSSVTTIAIGSVRWPA